MNTILRQVTFCWNNSRGTHKPAGKMNFNVLLIGVMLFKGMQLHRHMNRHGHQRKMTDPLRETNKLCEIDNAADKQKPVKMTMVQKDFSEDRLRSNPGSVGAVTLKEYSTNVVKNEVHDEKVMPKPGIRKNKLVANMGQISDGNSEEWVR